MLLIAIMASSWPALPAASASFDLLQGLAPYHDAGSVSPRSDVPLPQGGEIWDEMVGWNVSADFMWEQGPRLRDFWMIHSSQ